MRKGIRKALKGHADPTPEAAETRPTIAPVTNLTARHKPRAKVYSDGAVEAPAAIVSPQDGTLAHVHQGAVYDDSENEYPVSGLAASRPANRILKFFGLR